MRSRLDLFYLGPLFLRARVKREHRENETSIRAPKKSHTDAHAMCHGMFLTPEISKFLLVTQEFMPLRVQISRCGGCATLDPTKFPIIVWSCWWSRSHICKYI